MRIKNTKVKLRLKPVSLPSLNLHSGFYWLELLILAAGTAAVLFTQSQVSLLNNWLGFIVMLLVLRLTRLLFYGNKAFPSISFDLGLLIAITAILVITIIQGEADNYATLGGTNILGIGAIILSGLTLYLLATSARNYPLRWLWHGLHLLLVLKLLHTIFWGDTGTDGKLIITPDLAIIALLLLPLSIVGLRYFTHIGVRLLNFISLAISVLIIAIAANWQLLLILTVGLILHGIVGLALSRARELSYLNLLAQGQAGIGLNLVRGLAFWSLVLGLFALALVVVGYFTHEGFSLTVDNITKSYTSLDSYFSDKSDILTGRGLSLYVTDVGAALLSYGLLGLLVMGLFAVQLLSLTGKQVLEFTKGSSVIETTWVKSLFAGLFLILALNLLGTGNLLLDFVAISVLAVIWAATDQDSKSIKADDYIDYGQIASNWQFFFTYLRLVVILALVIFTPAIVDFLKELF